MVNTDNRNSTKLKTVSDVLRDPVLWYTTLIMTALMYHYRSELTIVYGAASLVISAALFFIFRFVEKHRFIGPPVYIAVMISFFYIAKICIEIGASNYPIGFMLWFLTPQDALEYNAWYTLAIYLLFMIFMASVIYYFTKIRYRILMNFLIFIIPFTLYGKEYMKMPTVFIMLLAVGYVVIMINYRQLEGTGDAVIIGKKNIWSSVASYVVLFAAIAAITPKPLVEADRTYIEQMISADAFTDRLVEILAVFRDTTTNDNVRNDNDERIIYYANASEDLRLKLQSYSEYNYDKDSWSVSDNDSKYNTVSAGSPVIYSRPGEILLAIGEAVSMDADFAEEFGLSDTDFSKAVLPPLRNLHIQTITTRAQFAPVPTGYYSMFYTSYSGDIAHGRSGSVACKDGRFASWDSYSFKYTTGAEFMSSKDNRQLASLMSRDDYRELLEACSEILDGTETRNETVVDDHLFWYENFSPYLDYGENESIEALATEITDGLTNDYDKALAIEQYFFEEDFVYDLSYAKSSRENAETFLFQSKRGVCYEFASAMVLLARASGIPARYCEGYNMSERYENNVYNTNYIIKAKYAHGFPELYIRGVGWVSFEPTVSSVFLEEAKDTTATKQLSRAGIILIVMAVLLLIAIKLYPIVSHRIFLRIIRKKTGKEACIRIMKRICALYKISSASTSHQACELVMNVSGADIASTAELFDKAVYGESELSEAEKQTAVNEYINCYTALNESRKRKNRKTKAGTIT